MKGIYLKLSILAYTIFVLCYNFFDVTRLTNHYYVFQNCFMLMVLFIDYKSSDITDKLFINYARILTALVIVYMTLSLFQDGIKQYGLALLVSSVILSIFGSLIALYLEIRRDKR